MMTRRYWLAQFVAVSLLSCCLLPGSATAQFRSRGIGDWLRRMDTNGNGMLDPNELQGPASFMLQRLARDNPQIDTSKPISIDVLTRVVDRARQQRGGDDRRGSSSDRNSSSNSSSSRPQKQEIEPLVPGFGVENDLPPISGFGDLGEFFSVKVTAADRQSAERSFRYYDRNQDGKIDVEEMSRSRSGDLKQYDKNGDGVLTKKEMAVRYARRRLDQEQPRQSSRSSSSRSSSSSSGRTSRSSSGRFSRSGRSDGGSSGDNPRDRIAGLISGFFGRRGDRSGASGDRPGSTGRSSGSSRRFGSGRRSDSTRRSDSGDSDSAESDRKSHRFLTPAERLPDGVPQWFIDDDQSGDGQVQMSEFTDRWTDALAKDFSRFDANDDGIITSKEVISAIDRGVVRGGVSESFTSSRISNKSNDAGEGSIVTGGSPIDARTLKYFREKFRTDYDKNKDGVLTKEEWSKMPKDPSAADADADGRITVEEYARWKTNS